MVSSSVGLGGGLALLEKKTLFLSPFHHFNNSNYNNLNKNNHQDESKTRLPVIGSTHQRPHLLSIGLQQSLQFTTKNNNKIWSFICFCSTNFDEYSSDDDDFATPSTTLATKTSTAPLLRKKKRYRKQYPGENEGIVQEMRFVAMRLRNDNSINGKNNGNEDEGGDGDGEGEGEGEREGEGEGESSAAAGEGETWQPSMEGFIKYLVNSKLVFQTLEHVVDDSDDIAYTYFRKTGLERSERLEKDLEWFRQQNLVIPEPSNPGVSYAEYLKELAEKNSPSFLCHFYNIYFAHISGGQVIGKQVSERLLEGRELEFYRWEGDASELLKNVRENLNKLGEHWSRDEKNKCLREAAKSFRYLGQIVRLIIL